MSDHVAAAELSRRALLTGTAAAAVSATTGLGRAHAETRLPLVPARPADSLAEAWGMNVHYDFRQSIYGHTQRVTEALVDLGVRHIRGRYKPGVPEIQNGFRGVAEHGCRVTAICGVFGDPRQASMAELMRGIVNEFGSDARHVFSALEGINEPNNNDVPWVSETRQRQAELWRARNGRSQTAQIPVLGPALARRVGGVRKYGMTNERRTRLDFEKLGDLTRYCTHGNIHVYPPDGAPSQDIHRFEKWSSAAFRGLPRVCTEGGYWSAMNYKGGANPVPEKVAAQYIPRQLLEHFIRGNRFFSYELMDDHDRSNSARDANFGFVRSNWTNKPQYRAMRRLLRLVSDRGAPFKPEGLRYTIAGGGDQLRTALLQKRNGVHYLCMWRDVKLYDWNADTNSGHHLGVHPRTVTVTLERATDVAIHRPVRGGPPVRAELSGRSFDVKVRGGLSVVQIG